MSQKTQISALSSLSQQLENLSCRTKLTFAHQLLEKLHLKFPHLVDASAFKELDRITAFLEEDFIQQRSANLLSKLAYSIALVRKKLSHPPSLLSMATSDIRVMPHRLHFTFGSKPILGLLAHALLQDKYEAFDEEHILLKIKKQIPDVQLIKSSVYAFQPPKSNIKSLYFEIDKKSGLPFNPEEIKQLRSLLKQEIQFCIEQLVPRIFMTRNEEEVLKNILTLSRELRHPSDSPEVMILLDKQTSQEAIFTIILVQIGKKITLASQLANVQGNFTYFLERNQIVSYLDKHPIEASVFRIHLPKSSSILRSDLSIHFYLARQKITHILTQAIGEFRDFNGGIILKQRETLSSLIEEFPSENPDIIENFFYSLSPIEAQASLSSFSLGTLFNLFLESMRSSMAKSSDCTFLSTQNSTELFLMIRLPDANFKEILEPLFVRLTESKVISFTLHHQNSSFFGYLIQTITSDAQDTLKSTIATAIENWKLKKESQRTLKLGLEHPIVSLDPRIGGDYISSVLLKMLSEGLMRENRDGQLEHGISSSVEISSDLKTYLFKLRPTYWSDGSQVTALDFEYAWKKVLSPSFKTPFAYLFYPIKNAQLAKSGASPLDAVGIQAVDEMTLKVELQSPTPYFLELTAHTIYSPIHRLVDQLHPNWPFEEGKEYVCNGAFSLATNNPAQEYELIKNPLYWDAENIQFDRVSFVKMNRYQSFETFKEGTNSWVGPPLCSWDPLFVPSQDDEAMNFLSYAVVWMTFNCAKPPFNHKKIRQAFSMAIDRDKLASLLKTQPVINPIPPAHSSIQPPTAPYFNPQQAKRLFKEALEELGLSRSDFPSVSFIHLKESRIGKLLEIVKRSWEATFDITCILSPLPWNTLFTKLTKGDYEIGYTAWQSWVNDPMYTLNALREAKEPINFSKWEDRKYQEILSMAEKEVSIEARQRLYTQAEQLLLEEVPVTSMFSNPLPVLKKKKLKIRSGSYLINFKWAYTE